MSTPLIQLSAPAVEKVVIHLDDSPAQRVGPKTFRKRVLRYGAWNHRAAPGGVLKVDSDFCEKLVTNFSAGVWDHVAVPYGHPSDEAAAARDNTGEVVALEHVNGDGLYATMQIDPAHAEKIGTTVKGVSAGILPSYTDHEIGGRGEVGPVLAHIALTNEPYIKGLGEFEPVHLAEAAKADGVLLTPAPDPTEGTPAMTREELLAAAKELGLDIPALEAAASKVSELEAQIAAAPKPEEVEADLVTALGEALVGAQVITLAEGEKVSKAALVGAIATMAKEGREATVKLAETEAEAAVAEAVRDGRILPSKRDTFKALFLSDRATFDALTDTKVVDFSEHGSTGSDLTDPSGGTTDAQAEIDRYAAMAAGL